MIIPKRDFIKNIGLAAFSTLPIVSSKLNDFQGDQKILQLEGELVEEFIRVAHSDFSKVQAMLTETPHLLNASHDWGDGDFETAIGAAGHMGNKEMANFLIDQGCRFDIFALTMLGKTEIVKAWLALYPNLLNAIGPHGFTLLHHAKQGGEEATELFDHLSEFGLTETFIPTFKK
jgi:hypothetical protein